MTERNMDKKEQIIKTAMQLFAVKGSTSTSMQEIAELCGISKGSLYLIFKSKEELKRSIYIYCFRMIRDPLLREEQESRRTPQEKLRNQIEILLNHVYELREFLQRQIQELSGREQTEVPEWLRNSNLNLFNWFQIKLESLYGKEILPYTGDLCLMAHGMISSYVRIIFYQETPISIARIADHLVDMLDIIVSGLLTRQPDPLISSAVLSGWMEIHKGNQRRNPLQLIKEMKDLLSTSAYTQPQAKEDILESLTILEGEILVPHPRRAIMQGMLSNLQTFPELATELEELQKLIIPYMHNICSVN